MRAKRSVHAKFNQELSFEEGDVIKVLVSAEDMWSRGMWWPGELHGKKGLFATEHVESFNQENVRRSELSNPCLYCVVTVS